MWRARSVARGDGGGWLLRALCGVWTRSCRPIPQIKRRLFTVTQLLIICRFLVDFIESRRFHTSLCGYLCVVCVCVRVYVVDLRAAVGVRITTQHRRHTAVVAFPI